MDHTKEPTDRDQAYEKLGLIDPMPGTYQSVVAAELSSLRSALAEKTAQVEQYRTTVEEVARQRNEAREQGDRLREALIDFKDLTSRHVQWTARGKEMKSIADRLEKIDEAIDATAPDATK